VSEIKVFYKENKTMEPKKIITALALLGCMASGVVLAKDNGEKGTLEKISRNGLISLGHRESSIPFSYYAPNQKVVGYSQDFVEQIVAAIKQKLGKPNLQITLTPITSQNRMVLLNNGMIDMECGSTSHNHERQKQVAFSNTIFIAQTRLLVKKTSGIKDFADLQGKTVVTTAGTNAERLIRKMKQEKGFPQNIISAKDHSEAFLALASGRAAAFMMDDALLAGERAKSKNPGDYEIVGKPVSQEAYACMMRKNDPAFKKVVDDTITEMQRSGKADQIYARWFTSPILPDGIDLKFPKSQAMVELYKNPNDRIPE
jgi:glutamate/aspartate transport system substrate-binding protein